LFLVLTLLLLTTLFMPNSPPTLELSDIHGVMHRPLELHGDTAAVFIFIGVDCPISNGYAPEINRIIADYTHKHIDFYVVYADATLTPDAAAKHAAAYGYTCPALLDPRHRLADRMHATVTPEVAIINADETILYHGRIDDLYLDFGKKRFAANTHDLRDALDAIVNKREIKTPETKAVGCPM
jgi:Redoxin